MKNLLKHLGYSLRRGDLKRIEGAFGSARNCSSEAGSSCKICDGDTGIQYICTDGYFKAPALVSSWVATSDISTFWNAASSACANLTTPLKLYSITTCNWTTP
ncbi:MAG: hypothetical protein QM528_07505 [Phycisphaerales bacterium]|nr:hypothetical protein [Phycisphaerales bacterium]